MLFDIFIDIFLSEEEKLLKYVSKTGLFSSKQIEQIELGVRNHLKIDKLRFYSNPNFTPEKMQRIRIDLENNLTFEQVNFLYNNNFSENEICCIKFAFIVGISKEIIEDNINFNNEYDKKISNKFRDEIFFRKSLREFLDNQVIFNCFDEIPHIKENLEKYMLENLDIEEIKQILQCKTKITKDDLTNKIAETRMAK